MAFEYAGKPVFPVRKIEEEAGFPDVVSMVKISLQADRRIIRGFPDSDDGRDKQVRIRRAGAL